MRQANSDRYQVKFYHSHKMARPSSLSPMFRCFSSPCAGPAYIARKSACTTWNMFLESKLRLLMKIAGCTNMCTLLFSSQVTLQAGGNIRSVAQT